jgi:adenylate cyclase
MKIISSLQVKLTEGDQARTWTRQVKNPAVQEKIWKAREYIQRFNQDGNINAQKMAKDIIRLEPDLASGYEILAWTHVFDINFGWTKSPSKSLEEAFRLTEKALSLDDSIANTHSLLAYLYLIKRQYDEAINIGERAVAINPNAADSMATLGLIFRWAGRPEEAVEYFKKAMRLNPLPLNYYFVGLGNAYFDMGRYKEAIAEYKKAAAKNPDDLTARIGLAAAYSFLNQEAAAHNEASEILRIHRKFSLKYYAKTMPFKNQNDREKWIHALQKAGLPE